MRTAIVTDSNCGISKEEAGSLGIFMVPMPVCINNKVYHEGIDLDQKSFFEHLSNYEEIHTSQPSPGDVTDMWKKVLMGEADELVYIPMSSGLSNSCSIACQLAEDFSGKVHVADVHRISATQRHAVQDALSLASQGLDAVSIKKLLEANAWNSMIFVGVDDLRYLKRGGRITPAAAGLASVLSIKPLLSIYGEKLDAYAKVRGSRNCQKRLVKAIQEQVSQFTSQGHEVRIGIAGSFVNEADSREWYQIAKETFPDDELIYDPLTCSISSHVGPNAFGMGVSVTIRL